MGLWAVLSQLLCGAVKDDLDECHRETVRLRVERDLLVVDAEALRGEVDGLRGEVESLGAQLISAEEDAARLYEQLRVSVQIPGLPDLSGKVRVYPYDMTPSQWGPVRPIVISDVEYYTWAKDMWLKILAPIQAEVKRTIGRAKPSIADCENWTLAICDLVSLAFMRAGLDRQGAFLKLLSKPHSYCGFMLPDYTIWVYEPMNGTVVGKLGETGPGDYGDDTYLTEQAFFLA